MKCSQVGMLAAIGGRFVVLDYVSDVEAFAPLHDPLVAGYALDALEPDAVERAAPSLDDARDFLALLLDAPDARGAGVGLGERFASPSAGSAAPRSPPTASSSPSPRSRRRRKAG